jgi:dienelactone hydrolase
MSSRLLNSAKMKSLQPATELWAGYEPENAPLAFGAKSQTAARTWQSRTRKALRKAVGFQNNPACDPAPKRIERVDKGDYVREKIVIRTTPLCSMSVYVLIPKGATVPLPVVLALHGHGYGVKDIVGLWEDGEERDHPSGYHKDFAVALCRRGFAVAAPEISCFGERQSHFPPDRKQIPPEAPPTTCVHTSMLASHLGGTALGIRVRDARRLVDYLASRPDLNTRKLGVMGISGGGMHALFSTCIDTRIKACVISGYFAEWRHSIHGMFHCACNYVPGLGQFGEIYDLAGLMAPRPVLIEAATRDPIFPIRSVKRAVARTRQVYDIFSARSEVKTDIFEARHEISGAKAYDFLAEYL